jgi:hypothetical protein
MISSLNILQNYKFIALILMVFSINISCERIFHEELFSEDRMINRVKNFNEWYQQFNPSSKVEAKYGEDKKLHLIAKSPIKAEESYLIISKNHTINPNLIYSTKIGSFVKELEENHGYDDHLNMVLYLVHEMGNPESQWKPYLDILPRKIDNLAFKYWEKKGPIEEEILHTPFLSKLN